MSRKLLILPLVIILLSSLAIFGTARADIIEITKVAWGSLDSPVDVGPGDSDVKLNIALTHLDTGKDIICAIQAWIRAPPNTPFPFTNWDGSSNIHTIYLSQLRLGESAVLEFTVDILEYARPGTYTADLVISYRDCSDENLPITQLSRQVQLRVSEPVNPHFLKGSWYQNGVEVPVGPNSGVAELVVWFEVPRGLTVSNILGELRIDSPIPAGVVRASFIGTVQSGGSFSLSFPIRLEGMTLGQHMFYVDLSYRNQWNTLRSSSYKIAVDINGREDLEVEQTPITVSRGSYAEVSAKVTNIGSAVASRVKLSLTPQSGYLKVLKNIYEFSEIKPGEELPLTVLVYVDSSSPTGPSIIAVKSSYQDVLGRDRVEEFQLSVDVVEQARPGFLVRLGDRMFNASTTDVFTIEFVNKNPYKVTDVRLSLTTSGTPLTFIEGDLTRFTPVMNPEETVRFVNRLVIPPAAADSTYIIRASVEYRDPSGMIRSESFEIPVAARGDIDLLLRNVRFSPEVVKAGDNVDVVGDVVNTGTTVARSVLVELLGNRPMLETVDSSSFIGLVNPSQVSSFTLAFRVDEAAMPGTYTALLRVSYKNGFGEKFTITHNFQYIVAESSNTATTTTRTSPSTPSQGVQLISPLTIAVVAVAAVVGFLVGRGMRRR
ncbi:MAG: hypothetical protein QXI97_06610 [Nitrososphaerota archaeon]